MASFNSNKVTAGIPSLLDRLTDRKPEDHAQLTREQGELPALAIEEGILRDLEWLLNTTALSATEDLRSWEEVRRSVLNYGVALTVGRMLTNADLPKVEGAIRRAIIQYEPRLRKETLRVSGRMNETGVERNQISLTVEGEYWDNKELKSLELRASIDNETGRLAFA